MTALSLQSTAKRLIAKHGRSVDFKKILRTPADSSKPWRAGATSLEPAGTVTTIGVFVDPTSLREMGYKETNDDAKKKIEKICLVAGDVDLTGIDVCVDGATEWKVVGINMLQPGATKVVYAVELCR